MVINIAKLIRSAKRAAYYEARATELHNRAVLRNEMRGRRTRRKARKGSKRGGVT